jgi:hypothetical protein
LLLCFAKMRRRRSPESWKQKVHPLFVEGIAVYRDAVLAWQALGPHPSNATIEQIRTRFDEDLSRVREQFANAQHTPTAADPADIVFVDGGWPSTWPPTQSEMDRDLLQHLYWGRFREPLWIALQKTEAGDIDAQRRVNTVVEEYQRRRFGKGPIKATKSDPDHAALFEIGLDMGLSRLTPEELADCFDDLCPCGEVHDADALKKQRYRLQETLQKARDWAASERAKTNGR